MMPTQTTSRPRFRPLRPREMQEVLRRNSVGRLAYADGDGQLSIEPVHYVFADDVVYGRTSSGSKLQALWERPALVFEVDEIDGPFEWRSVVAHGTFHRVPDGPTLEARSRWQEAVDRLRRLDPRVLTPDDPTPDRTVLFRIPVSELTGRMASAAGAGEAPLPLERPAAPFAAGTGGGAAEESREPEEAGPAAEPIVDERATLRPWVRGFLGFRLSWKILIANGLIVAAAILAGAAAASPADAGFSTPLLLTLLLALVATVALNAVILELALDPLRALTEAARRVAAGDLSARARVSAFADRDTARLVGLFNRMVDGVQAGRDRLRAVASRALSNAEEDRRRVSAELQEDAAQSLASVLVLLRGLRRAEPSERERLLGQVREGVVLAIERLRSCATDLRPSGLDMLGVGSAIETYARQAAGRAGLELDVRAAPLALHGDARLALFRVAEQAIDNVVDHAAARVLRIRMKEREGEAQVVVEDDGRGFSLTDVLSTADRAVGLFAMQETAAYFGGAVGFHSRPGGGTRVEIVFPLESGTTD